MSRWLGGDSRANGNDQYTKVLLHFDNSYSDTNFGGSSHTWSPQNSPGFSTDSKFGSHSFQGTAPHPAAPATPARYVQASDSSDFTLGASDFTIDFWLKTNLGGAISMIANQEVSWRIQVRQSALGTVNFFASFNGSSYALQANGQTSAWSDGSWKHVAVVRSSNNFTVYVDGVGGTPVSNSGTINDSSNPVQLILGSGGAETALYDEFRLSVGIARWTSNFTPPTTPYSRFIGSSI